MRATSEAIDWDVCGQCAETAASAFVCQRDECWAHADEQDLGAALKRLGEDSHIDARGAMIHATLMQPATCHRCSRGAPTGPANSRFERATFIVLARFECTTFKGEAGFGRPAFEGECVDHLR